MTTTRFALVLLSLAACGFFAASCGEGPAPEAGKTPEKGESAVKVEKTRYGALADGREVHLFTLTNPSGMRVRLTNYGAICVSVEVPDKDGNLGDVTLGYDTLKGWLGNTSYFGATVGRYANRIAKAEFELDGKTYRLAANNGENHLHGGIKGFDKRLWKGEIVQAADSAGVRFTRTSPDGEEGYPGNLQVAVLYTLTTANELKIEFTATTDKPTICNLAHHTYWNLRGPENGDVLGHVLMIRADRYTPVNEQLIPTGELAPVEGTPFDFRQPKPIGRDIAKVPGGYDHNFVLNDYAPGKVRLAVRVTEPTTGRVMEIYTDQPGVQFYSGNFLDGSITGKKGVKYQKHYGFCLETQHYPDSPHHPEWPSVVLRPGQTYRHVMICKFSVTK